MDGMDGLCRYLYHGHILCWHVAHGKAKNRELDFLDYWGYHFCPVIFVQRAGFYEFPVLSIYLYCHIWIQIMEEDYKQRPVDLVKVVLFGPESTGKTTLAMMLSQHYNTAWVPEFAREYLQVKWDKERKTCEEKDLLPIARGQMRLENQLAEKANRILICDTDLLETKVYSEQYYGAKTHPILDRYATLNSYDLYLLTNIDIPWEEDDLRDRPQLREEMFIAFKEALINHSRPYVVLSGNLQDRMGLAIQEIDRILKEKFQSNT